MGLAASRIAALSGAFFGNSIEPRLITVSDPTANNVSWPQELSPCLPEQVAQSIEDESANDDEECERWSRRVVELVETNARQAALDPGTCGPFRTLADFFKGQASPALRLLARCPEAYAAVRRSLVKRHPVQAWRDLASYAHAELVHAVKEGNWDPRVFPDAAKKSIAEIYGKRDHKEISWRSKRMVSLISDIRVVTTASEECPQLDVLRASCRLAELDLTVLGLEQNDTVNGYSHYWKHRLLAEYLRTVPDSVGILVVDAYDVVISRNAKSILLGLNSTVIFSTERDCWPDSSVCRSYPVQSRLNSGSFYGRTVDLRAMLYKMERDYGAFLTCGNDDQRAYQRFAIDSPNLLDLDLDSRIFQTMHGYNWTLSFDTEGLPQLFDDAFPDKEITPAVLHFNSHDGKAMYATYTQALQAIETRHPVLPRAFVVSLADRAHERRETVVRELDRAGFLAHIVNAVDGDTLHRSSSPVDTPLVATWRSDDGINVRGFDWTDPLLGGDSMSEQFTKRVIACALSHLKAIAAAKVMGQWPALILEDDADLEWMPSEQKLLSTYVPKDDDNWTIVQLASLTDDPYVAADFLAKRCVSRQILLERNRCAPPEQYTGTQAYLISEKGAQLLLKQFGDNTMIDLTQNGTINFAADYLLYNLDGVYIATQPVSIEVPSRSTIGIGHDRLAHATRALSTAILHAPCDSAVVAAARHVLSESNDESMEPKANATTSVLVGDTIVSLPAFEPQKTAQSILSALGIVDLKVASLLTQALVQCSNSCIGSGGLLFPSPLRCFNGGNPCDSPDTCRLLGLRLGNCAAYCDAMSSLNDIAEPCGELWCTKVRKRHNPVAEEQHVLHLSDTKDPKAFAYFARQLASSTSINPSRRILFASVADAWDALNSVLAAHNGTFLDLEWA